MEEILKKLIFLGLTKTEAIVYIELLKNGKSTGYKISQSTNLSRASVYQALDSLYSKGIVFLVSSQNKEYISKNPKILLAELENEYKESIKFLDIHLEEISLPKKDNYFLSIEGYDNIIKNLKEMIKNSKEEFYISSNFNMKYFKIEIIDALKRGVRVIFYSSIPVINNENIPIELYCRKGFESVIIENTRLIAVSDNEESLIFDNGEQSSIGICSNNTLFTKIILEHIHHDIYIARLIDKYGEVIKEDIQINSKHEKSFKNVIDELKKLIK